MNADQDVANADFSILDGTLDDIDDLPGFLAFPSGAYHVKLEKGLVKKVINKHPALECAMTCVEVKELSNPEDAAAAPKVGDIATTSFMLDNETGRGMLKRHILEPLGKALNIVGNGAIVAASVGVQAIVVVKKTVDKEKGREYTNIVKLEVI